MAQSEVAINLEQFDKVVRPAFDMRIDFFDALSAGDIERAAKTFALDGSLLFPGLRPVRGRALVKRMLGIIRRRYEMITWQSSGPAVFDNGWLVTSWSVSGTFKDSNLPYENEVLSLVRLDPSGLIASLSDYFKDTLAFHPKGGSLVLQENRRLHV